MQNQISVMSKQTRHHSKPMAHSPAVWKALGGLYDEAAPVVKGQSGAYANTMWQGRPTGQSLPVIPVDIIPPHVDDGPKALDCARFTEEAVDDGVGLGFVQGSAVLIADMVDRGQACAGGR